MHRRIAGSELPDASGLPGLCAAILHRRSGAATRAAFGASREAARRQPSGGDPAEACDGGRVSQPEVRPAGRHGLSRRRQQSSVRGRAAHGHDLVVPQRALDERQAAVPRSFPIRSTGETKRGCWAWRSIPSTRRTSRSSSTTRPNDQGKRHSVVSRFKASSDDPRAADPASEERIWVSAEDPFENHNGGTIAFGPDGYLYITLGDGGAADDPMTSGQNPTDWFGSILRIDVDHPSGGKPYGIPADNPARRSKKFARWAPEVYCIGLRNVWKFSFDRQTGDLWAGDVGQNLWEMVHRIENGGNYGWSIKEGVPPVSAPAPPAARLRLQDLAADRRVSPRPDPRPARQRPEHHRRLRLPRQEAARRWPASTSTATSTAAGSGACATRTASCSPTAS